MHLRPQFKSNYDVPPTSKNIALHRLAIRLLQPDSAYISGSRKFVSRGDCIFQLAALYAGKATGLRPAR
jgi:hypothetical protein